MTLVLSYCRYRLRFKHPFGTAHGLRDGTDSVFVRLQWHERSGFGEATLPPYLPETADSVIQWIRSWWGTGIEDPSTALVRLQESTGFDDAPSARAAVQMALSDLLDLTYRSAHGQSNGHSQLKSSITLMTVGSGGVPELEEKLVDTRPAQAVKVKLGAPNDQLVLERIKQLDDRMLFLDANQGLNTVQEALDRIAWAGAERVLGLEQPFAKDRIDLHRELSRATAVPIYGDESIQARTDLDRCAGAFGGVNIKLMKCGGLDHAWDLIEQAKSYGLRIMLGSMSESSLGCTAMARFASEADVVDLDGPWLLANDPFEGMHIANGQLVLPDGPGIGARPRSPFDWTSIVA